MSLLCIVLNKSSIDECVWALGLEIMSMLIMCSHFHVNHTSASMPRLNEAQRNQVIGMLINSSVNEVAQQFNVSRQTIHAIKLKQRQFGTVKDRPGRGRHPVTNAADNRQILLRHVRNRFLPATETARHFNIGSKTVIRRLASFGLKPRRPARRYGLTNHHKQRRLAWATAHRRWTLRQWENVVFSDESPFPLERHDTRERVYRRQGERYFDCNVSTANKRQKVMVWGAISATQKSPLIIIRGRLTAQRYVDEILQPVLIPFMHQHRNGMTFQHDGATQHTAVITNDFLTQNNVRVLPWIALSPDMNPIEHAWDILGRAIKSMNPAPRTIPELEAALIDKWNNIPQRYLRTLCLSIRRRCTALIAARGSHTRY